jgi:lysophospholipase L1-like esterase
MNKAVYLCDRETPEFQSHRAAIDIVCAGDSITGWNNFGPVPFWPLRTYPEFLQDLCGHLGRRVANGGIAGEVSPNGIGQVEDYLALFPNAGIFVIGYGTNDLGMWPRVEGTSPRIIENMRAMVTTVQENGRRPTVLNVPPANGSRFPREVADELRRIRDYHNGRLAEFCRESRVPLIDLAAKLRDEHFADELHPNDEGARKIAEAVYAVLAQLIQDEKKDVPS